MSGELLYEVFYVVVYCHNNDTEEHAEEFTDYSKAHNYYNNLEDTEYRVLQKVIRWENGEEYIEELENN